VQLIYLPTPMCLCLVRKVPTPSVVNPSNAWISDLIVEWLTGPSALVEVQKYRGCVILETLLALDAPVKRLNIQSSSSLSCEIFGPATREGPRPSQLLTMVDLLSFFFFFFFFFWSY
jgi:hypothetical protein